MTNDDVSLFTELNIRFSYHPPKGNQFARYEELRAGALRFAELIYASCPASFERECAIRKLQESVMWANASIACRDLTGGQG